jgi:hypothetical protein
MNAPLRIRIMFNGSIRLNPHFTEAEKDSARQCALGNPAARGQ